MASAAAGGSRLLPADGAPGRHPGAVGVHIGGTACRAAAGFEPQQLWRGALPPGGVESVTEAIAGAVHQVEAKPRFVVIATPGLVDHATGGVSGAANLGPEWTGAVPLGPLLQARLQCEVAVRNDAGAALEAERRRGGLVAVNDGALITLNTGVGVALLVNGTDQPTEMGHSVLQFDGPPCRGHPHRGCFESYLGGWALPLRYKESHPDFAGTAAREIPGDAAFWTDYGLRLGELVVQLCLLGRPMEVVSLVGQIAHARGPQILPAVRQRIGVEAALLDTVPRRIDVTPLGDDVAVVGALLVARDLLYPFQRA